MSRIVKTVALLGAGWVVLALAAFGQQAPKEEPGYVGASKCKNCHRSSKGGDQYGKWKESKHSKAYEALASEEAKKLAAAKGIEDPQKSDACLKCHIAAFGVDAKRLGKKYSKEEGVQCETCHGPGEKHQKDRMAAAASEEEGKGDEKETPRVQIPEGEINANPSVDLCLGCHNQESPSFKPLCIQDITREVLHLDPRKKRTEAEVAAIKKNIEDQLAAKNASCGGPAKCEKCKKASGQ